MDGLGNHLVNLPTLREPWQYHSTTPGLGIALHEGKESLSMAQPDGHRPHPHACRFRSRHTGKSL